jgi:putative PIN family toxin of toxin-antitoxin system
VIRVVFDTNLLVSYLLTHRPPIATLIDDYLAREAIVTVTAPELLEELHRVLDHPRLQRYHTDAQRQRFVALVLALSELVEPPPSIPRVSRDPDDDRVIACAVVGRADVIVSGDDDLMVLERVGNIPILSAAAFLDLLSGDQDEQETAG